MGRLIRTAAVGLACLCGLGPGCGRSKPDAIAISIGGAPGSSTPSGSGGAPGAGGDSGSPTPASPWSARGLRRLSNREYDNVVRDLLGDTSHPGRTFLPEAYQNGFDNGSAGLAVQSDQVESYQLAAESLAATAVATRPSLLLGGCDPAISVQANCVEAFLRGFAARAFRRPLGGGEADRLRAIHAAGAAVGGFSLGLQLALETVLESPQFLYREELGSRAAASMPPAPGGTAPTGSVRLTSYEIASELSFLLTGSIPDDPLWNAVGSGRFENAADYLREATRLLQTTAARESLRRLLHQWLGTDLLALTTKDPVIYPSFTPALAQSMFTDVDRTFERVLGDGPGSLGALFTTTDAFVDPALAVVYGIAPPAELTPVSLDPGTRPGILTRAGFLTVHADSDSSGPVTRGVFLLTNVLCAPPLERPADVPSPQSAIDAQVAGLTTRQRFSQHQSDPRCSGCHTLIDGIGFGFEAFDGIGAYRASENGMPIDDRGNLFGTGDVDGPFAGASELAARLGRSRRLSDCFVKQFYRFAMGQVEGPAQAPVLAAISSGFSNDARISDLVLSLIGDPAFTTRAGAVGGAP